MESHTLNKTMSKVFLLLVKYIPIFSALVIMAHASMQLLNVNDFILDHLIRPDLTSVIFIVCASYLFRFCWIHRLFIGYDTLMSLEMTWHEKFGLYHSLEVHRLGAICIGLIAFIILIYYRGYFVYCGKINIGNKSF